ncbi:unnamed protein product, partial [Rotaria sp. Silwood2]
DNNEQRLILTNDIEDIGQQTESSIKLIRKTKTFNEKFQTYLFWSYLLLAWYL